MNLSPDPGKLWDDIHSTQLRQLTPEGRDPALKRPTQVAVWDEGSYPELGYIAENLYTIVILKER